MQNCPAEVLLLIARLLDPASLLYFIETLSPTKAKLGSLKTIPLLANSCCIQTKNIWPVLDLRSLHYNDHRVISRVSHLYTNIEFHNLADFSLIAKCVPSLKVQVTVHSIDDYALSTSSETARIDTFNLIGVIYTPKQWSSLSRIIKSAQIEFLLIKSTTILPPCFLNIAQSIQNITRLELNVCKINDKMCIDLAKNLVGNKKLTALNLNGNYILDGGFMALVEILASTCIKSLEINRNGISYIGAVRLAQSLADTKLERVSFRENVIQDEGCIAISRVLRDCSLEEIDFYCNCISKLGCLELSKGIIGSRIKSLNLARNTVGFEVYRVLIPAIRKLRLHALILFGDSSLTCQAAKDFAKSIYSTDLLTIIDVSDCLGADAAVSEFAGFVSANTDGGTMLDLDLSNNFLGVRDWQELMQSFINNPKIVGLKLPGLDRQSAGLAEIIKHISLTRIIKLDFSKSQLVKFDYDFLDSLVNSNVTQLDLSGNFLGRSEFGWLSWYISESNLSYLVLINCKMDDAACVLIAKSLLCTQKLEMLDVRHNLMTEVGAVYLVSRLQLCKPMKKFWMSSSKLALKSEAEWRLLGAPHGTAATLEGVAWVKNGM